MEKNIDWEKYVNEALEHLNEIKNSIEELVEEIQITNAIHMWKHDISVILEDGEYKIC